jgi:rubrerythrin
MKKPILILILSIFSFAACQTAETKKTPETTENVIRQEAEQTSVKDEQRDETINLDERTRNALLDALADERRAQASYEAVVEKFGEVRPFINIVNAERRHESFLLPLFEKYSMKVPENEYTNDKAQVSGTLGEACQSGVAGEKANIEMYDKFLEFVKETDIRQTFTYLRDASKDNHLPAFERCGGQGGGKGRGKNF